MKDYAAAERRRWVKEDPRLRGAIAYLRSRGIWRGEASCRHQYTNSRGEITSPEGAILFRRRLP